MLRMSYSCFHSLSQSEVVRSQTTESMSFPLSVMSGATTLSWTVYGLLVKDIYVQVSGWS